MIACLSGRICSCGYGVRGTGDKKANLEALKAKGYPSEKKIFTGCGHGGLAGEHSQKFVEEAMRRGGVPEGRRQSPVCKQAAQDS